MHADASLAVAATVDWPRTLLIEIRTWTGYIDGGEAEHLIARDRRLGASAWNIFNCSI
ncbi:MAG: hypothetical protein MZV65_47150 [Chromatiales bacterium]|nr:hypothetical protein [Chromatiales bacterium]